MILRIDLMPIDTHDPMLKPPTLPPRPTPRPMRPVPATAWIMTIKTIAPNVPMAVRVNHVRHQILEIKAKIQRINIK